MKKLVIMLLMIMTAFGCASQSEVNALKKEIESMKAEHAQHQRLLEKAFEEAQDALDQCKLSAEHDFDQAWKANSTPVKSKPGMRSGNRETLNHLNEEQHRADAECQHEYENALQKAKLLYGAS